MVNRKFYELTSSHSKADDTSRRSLTVRRFCKRKQQVIPSLQRFITTRQRLKCSYLISIIFYFTRFYTIHFIFLIFRHIYKKLCSKCAILTTTNSTDVKDNSISLLVLKTNHIGKMVGEVNDPHPVLMTPFTISNKRCRAYFRTNVLMWRMEAPPFETQTIPVSDIIAVNYGNKNACNRISSGTNDARLMRSTFSDASHPTDYSHTSLVVHFTKHVSHNKWRIFSETLQHSDAKEVASWFVTLENALKKEKRPKNFLVFINPFCGKRKGLEVYNKIVKPVLELAKVDTDVVVTQSSAHTKDCVLSADIKKYDGIMAVGGDGTVSEVINSLIIRIIRDENQNENEWDIEIPKIKPPVAIIPCGSTDCVAYCLNGTQDRKTAAIFAVLGCHYGLDVCSVYSQRGFCRYFLGLLAYGFLGDVLKESEKHRWMGPRRYDYAGFLKALKNRRYYCEMSMVLSHQAPGIGPKCYRGCDVCNQPFSKLEKARYQEKNLSAIKNDLKLDLKEVSNTEKTVTVRGKYFMVGCANVSCACERSPNGFSPYSHIGDGSMDVLLIRPQSFLDILKIVMRSKSKTQALSDLSCIDIYKAKEMSVRVLDKNMEVVTKMKDGGRCLGASVWNCDGEIVLDSNIRVRNYRQLVQVFTRRMTPCENSTSASCWNRFNCSRCRVNENGLD